MHSHLVDALRQQWQAFCGPCVVAVLDVMLGAGVSAIAAACRATSTA